MPPAQPAPSVKNPWSSRSWAGWSIAVFIVALGLFARDLADPSFVDEYAYISQSYYADLMLDGRTNDRAWLELPAYDLVPLPKYLIGLALRVGGFDRPGPLAARKWYGDTSSKFGGTSLLLVARTPSAILAALGCVAVFGIGASAAGVRVGLVAAFLLAFNPLYRLHAHRAMSEAACESLMYLSILIAVWSARRTFGPKDAARARSAVALVGAGVAAGLSTLAKFNGLLALMTLAAWAVLGGALPNRSRAGKASFAAGACFAAAAAWGVFVGLDPFMTARPPGPLPPEARRLAEMNVLQRFRFLVDHRRAMSASQQEGFPHNALTNVVERSRVVAVQGFGRFGPFGPRKSDSTRRFDFQQDAGALVWLPICFAGMIAAVALGRRQQQAGEAPLAWALASWAALVLIVVTLYLPMAWDRYQLPIQAPCGLLAALFLTTALDLVSTRFRTPRTENTA